MFLALCCIIEQNEKAFQKQSTKTIPSRKVGKGKGKYTSRYYKNVGLGFKTPVEAKEGTYVDKHCPFTGNISIRGRILKGMF